MNNTYDGSEDTTEDLFESKTNYDFNSEITDNDAHLDSFAEDGEFLDWLDQKGNEDWQESAFQQMERIWRGD